MQGVKCRTLLITSGTTLTTTKTTTTGQPEQADGQWRHQGPNSQGIECKLTNTKEYTEMGSATGRARTTQQPCSINRP